MVNKGFRLGALGRSEEEIGVYDEVIGRFGEREEVQIAEKVAKAMVNKGFRLGALGRSEEAIGVYDEVIGRFGEREEVQIAEKVASAMVNKGFRLGALGKSEEEIGVYDEVIGRFGEREEVQIAEQVARAILAEFIIKKQKEGVEKTLSEEITQLVTKYAKSNPALASQIGALLNKFLL
jgi:tetratricopeptide (TPR) repeat protein